MSQLPFLAGENTVGLLYKPLFQKKRNVQHLWPILDDLCLWPMIPWTWYVAYVIGVSAAPLHKVVICGVDGWSKNVWVVVDNSRESCVWSRSISYCMNHHCDRWNNNLQSVFSISAVLKEKWHVFLGNGKYPFDVLCAIDTFCIVPVLWSDLMPRVLQIKYTCELLELAEYLCNPLSRRNPIT